MRMAREACVEADLLGRFGLSATPLPGPFATWLISTSADDAARLPVILSDDELARARRFRTAELRRRYCAAHAAVRLLAQHHFGIPAAHQTYATNSYGKPRLVQKPRACCSISYSGDKAVVAWSADAEIGIDIEVMRPIADAAELMKLHYTPREQEWVRQMAPRSTSFSRAFLDVWVRKEACLKALGCGLAIAPSSFDSGAGRRSRNVKVDGRDLKCDLIEAGRDLLVAWATVPASLHVV